MQNMITKDEWLKLHKKEDAIWFTIANFQDPSLTEDEFWDNQWLAFATWCYDAGYVVKNDCVYSERRRP